MIKATFFLSSLFLIISCSTPKADMASNTQDITSAETPEEGSVMIRDINRFPDIKNQNNLTKIVKELERADCVNENGIGFAAEYTRTYALFERMAQLATENQLLSFVKNNNPVVRVYAFRALKDMKYPSAA